MGRSPRWVGALALSACSAGFAAEDPKTAQSAKAWTNETELSVVLTEGNSNTESLGFKNTLRRRWENSSFGLKLEALRATTSDDWYEQVDPGVTWEPGADPPSSGRTLVKPPAELDVENYFVEGRYDRKIRERLDWHAGTSWDRNKDAGILNRTIVFGGVGNRWRDREDLRFQTSYGVSWSDREEETPDPEKDEQFLGARLGLTFLYRFVESTTYTSDWTTNFNLTDSKDWSSDMTNAISVAMGKRLSLRVSLRWLYANEPALEEIDVLARVETRDPDGVPGSGDEFFETVASGGSEVTLGEARVRRERLDQVFKTTLVVSF